MKKLKINVMQMNTNTGNNKHMYIYKDLTAIIFNLFSDELIWYVIK